MGVVVTNKTVCVTGKIPGHSRATANKELQQAGAHTVGTVTKNTHMLITGADVGPRKIENAEKLGVAIVPWSDIAWDGVGDEPVLHEKAPEPKALAFAQVEPMLAVKGELADTASGEWVYEIKWDGNRAVAHVDGDAVAIQSRSAKSDYTKRFPTVATALAAWSAERPNMGPVILDGEIIVPSKDGGGSFQALANHSNSHAAVFIVFDVIECGGRNLRQVHFRDRRDLLETMIPDDPGSVIRISPIWEDGETLLAHAQEHGLEGIMAKPLNSTYREHARGPWMKLKVRLAQEFVVLGYCPAGGQFEGGIGALILGYYSELAGGFVLCGEAGTGYTREQRFAFRDMLDAMADPTAEQNVAATDQQRRELEREGAVWVRPELVAQVEFQRWTEDGRLWHPSFQGFRDDKDPVDVIEGPPEEVLA